MKLNGDGREKVLRRRLLFALQMPGLRTFSVDGGMDLGVGTDGAICECVWGTRIINYSVRF